MYSFVTYVTSFPFSDFTELSKPFVLSDIVAVAAFPEQAAADVAVAAFPEQAAAVAALVAVVAESALDACLTRPLLDTADMTLPSIT